MDTIELHKKRTDIVARRTELMDSLASVKLKLAVTLPRHEYDRAESVRQNIVREVQQIDGQLSALKLQKHEAARSERSEEIPWVKELCDLRNGYQEFAADATRSPTMRRMASEFVVKLTPIIRRVIQRSGNDVLG